ncbi:MAG: methionine--tRNA ligase [Phycisphaeraceae bacterium]
MSDPFYITTPIYYVNDRPHIGHVYSTTIADVIARYHRLRGDDVFFLTGTDEHAAKVVESATKHGVSAQEWADKNAAAFENTFKRLGFTNNDFIRTSQTRHKELVRKYVKALLDSGDVYLGDYEGWYDAGQEEYVPENKAKENEYKSAISGRPLIRRKEKNYFFRLSSYREALLTLLEKGEAVDGCTFEVQPSARKNEIIERIRTAEDIPISRDVAGSGLGNWCITVPGDDTHAIYVWIDALFNYLTTVDTPDRRKYWQAGAVHLIAKDILWFHAAIWPALLLALRKCDGFGWVNLPKLVYSHSFWIAEGRKMSKSEGNFVDLEKIDQYIATFSLDALRYFLASNGPLGTTDSDFAEKKFIEVYNTDLANTLGNCLNRVANMTQRYCSAVVPSLSSDSVFNESVCLRPPVKSEYGIYESQWPGYYIDCVCRSGISLVSLVDYLIEKYPPFKMIKDERYAHLVPTILYNCAEALRIASLLLWPVIPAKCEEIWRRLGCDYAAQMASNDGRGKLDEWVKWGQLKPGTPLLSGDALFPRYQPPKG